MKDDYSLTGDSVKFEIITENGSTILYDSSIVSNNAFEDMISSFNKQMKTFSFSKHSTDIANILTYYEEINNSKDTK